MHFSYSWCGFFSNHTSACYLSLSTCHKFCTQYFCWDYKILQKVQWALWSSSSDGPFPLDFFQEYKRKLTRVTQVRKELRSRLNNLPGRIYSSSDWLKFHLPTSYRTLLRLKRLHLHLRRVISDVATASVFDFWKVSCVFLFVDLWFSFCLGTDLFIHIFLFVSSSLCAVYQCTVHKDLTSSDTGLPCFGPWPSTFYSFTVVRMMLVWYFCIYSTVRR